MSATLIEVSRAVGGLVATERIAFEITGRAVPTATPRVAAWLAQLSLHHAWRATELERHLWPFATFEISDFVVVPDELADVLGTVGATTSESAMVEVLRDQLIPTLAGRVTALIECCGEAADGSLRRSLEIVGDDLERDRRTAQQLAP